MKPDWAEAKPKGYVESDWERDKELIECDLVTIPWGHWLNSIPKGSEKIEDITECVKTVINEVECTIITHRTMYAHWTNQRNDRGYDKVFDYTSYTISADTDKYLITGNFENKLDMLDWVQAILG